MKKHSFLCAVTAIALLFVLFSCEGEIGQTVCKVRLVFDNNGLNETIETEVPAGLTFKIPAVVPLKDGCIFDHWEDDKGNVYKPGQDITIKSDVTVSAKWKTGADLPDNQVIVTYVLNDTMVAAQVVDKGTVITAPTDGYTIPEDNVFSGWYLEDESAHFDFSTPITEAVKLKAWIGKRVSVSINARNEELFLHYEIVSGMKVKKPETIPNRENCNFLYWYVNGNEDTPYDFNTPVTGDEYGSLYLEAKYDRESSAVTFDPDNGEEPTSQPQIWWNSTADVILDPLMEGKVFLGWFEEGSSTSFNFDTKITNDKTLKAKWGDSVSELESDKVVVTYDFAESTLTNRTVTLNKGNSYPVRNIISNPEPVGNKEFDYWKDEDGNEITHDYESQYVTVDENMTFTAVWKDRKMTVYFYTGGIDGSTITRTVYYGEAITDIPEGPEREGNSAFQFWYCDYDDEGQPVEYDFNTPVTGYLHLQAKWNPDYYVITFNPDNEKPSAYTTCSWGSRITPEKDPEKEGSTFLGWYTDDGKEYDFSTKVTDNLTLTAHWKEGTEKVEGTSKIKFVFDGEGTSYDIVTVKTGSSYNVSSYSNYTKVPSGYSLKCWKDEEGNEVAYGDLEISEDRTFTAEWETHTIWVRFYADYSDVDEYVPDGKQQIIDYGGKATPPTTDPVKEGNDFGGWTVLGSRTQFDFENSEIKTDQGAFDFYAIWIPHVYTVTVDYGYDEKTENLSINHGDGISLPTPKRDGYRFKGWKVDDVEGYYDISTPVTGALMITADWESTTTYNVYFKYVDGNECRTVSVSSGGTVSTIAPETKVPGTTFRGWYEGDAVFDPFIFTGKKFSFDTQVTSDVYLYAKFTFDDVAASWTLGGGMPLNLKIEGGKDVIYSSMSEYEEPYEVGEWSYEKSTGKMVFIDVDDLFGAYIMGKMPCFLPHDFGSSNETVSTFSMADFSKVLTYDGNRKKPLEDSIVGKWVRNDGRWTCTAVFTDSRCTETMSLYRDDTRTGEPVVTIDFTGEYRFGPTGWGEGYSCMSEDGYSSNGDMMTTFTGNCSYVISETEWGVLGIMGQDYMVLTRSAGSGT